MESIEQTQREAVLKEAREWIGTPYRHEGRIKGYRGGVDCGQILACIFENAGMRSKITTTSYPMQWALHQHEELYIKELKKYAREITEDEVLPADIVIYKVAHTFSHGAIVMEPWPGQILHSVNGLGVIYSDASREGFLKQVTKRAGAIPCRFFSAWG